MKQNYLDKGGANEVTTTQVKSAITDDHTHSNKATLDSTQEAFTTTLKNKVDGIVNPMLFKGAIAVNSDFPTSAEVQNGWTYRISADVTDNDVSKTNTGQSFLVDAEIAWNGTNWTDLGYGAVKSVNSKTGVVTLNQDEIGDGTTYKQYSLTEKNKLSGIEASAVALATVKGDSDVADAISKKHANTLDHSNSKDHDQGTDQGLDTDGANAVTAAQAKAGYTHSGVIIGNPHAVTKSDVGLGNVDDKSEATIITDVKADSDVADAISKKHAQGSDLPSSPSEEDLIIYRDGAWTKLSLGTVGQSLKIAWDSYTKVCSSFDGADEAVAYTDPIAGAYTFFGTAQLDTTFKKFGSAALLLDGNSDYVSLPDSDNYNYGTGDFTIEFWVRFGSLVATQTVYAQYADGTHRINIYINDNFEGGLRWIFQIANGEGDANNLILEQSAIWSASINTWYHIAFVKKGNTSSDCLLFIDGVMSTFIKYAGTWGLTMPDIVADLLIGQYGDNTNYLNGHLDEYRISKGIARYISNFTPRTIAFTPLVGWSA